jgi:hypothetical protein
MRVMAATAALLLLCAAATGAEPPTLYGFFPSPPVLTTESVIATFKAMGEHGSAVLIQRAIPWKEFSAGDPPGSADITDLGGIVRLARANGLEPVFVIDPLNGLDRRRFMNLPEGWTPSFANPDVRAAMTNYALRIVKEFHPRFLALGSEINTWQDTHPDDYPHYLALYREIYAKVKAAAPRTQVFVTFQWDELNNLMPGVDGGKEPYETRWEQVEAFEPRLDLWAISTYPYVVYRSAREIPADYYARLAARTAKPLAVAECGYTSRSVGNLHGSPRDQAMFLEALHDQLGARLRVWIYTMLNDISLDSYAGTMKRQGNGGDVQTLGWFQYIGLRAADGTPKPGLAAWDSFRAGATPR